MLDGALALAVVAAVACPSTLAWPGLLTAPAVMNGSARGTALVALVVGVPSLLAAALAARRGSTAGLAMAAVASAYLANNGVLLAFATPFNRAFLIYEAMLVWRSGRISGSACVSGSVRRSSRRSAALGRGAPPDRRRAERSQLR